jgi:hypothetical protein
MKRINKLLLALALSFGMMFAASAYAEAAQVSTLEVTSAEKKITVKGTTDPDVLACAVLVFDAKGENMIAMETCAVTDSGYNYTMDHVFSEGTYLVKVADYNGGDYVTKEVKVDGAEKKSPKTSGLSLMMLFIVAGTLSGTYLVVKKVRAR